jgi:hypothetical protein
MQIQHLRALGDRIASKSPMYLLTLLLQVYTVTLLREAMKRLRLSAEMFRNFTPEFVLSLFSAQNIQVDAIDGSITLHIEKGVLKKTRELYKVYVWMVGKSVVFGVYSESGLKTAAKLFLEEDTVVFECLESAYEELCKAIFNSLKRGLAMGRERVPQISAPVVGLGKSDFKLSKAYESILDGFAEVTIASATVKYPLIERRILNRVSDVGSIEEVIDYISSRFNKGVYVVVILAQTWLFSIAVDVNKKEYTPSYINWERNTRVVGKEALQALKKHENEGRVNFIIYQLQQ